MVTIILAVLAIAALILIVAVILSILEQKRDARREAAKQTEQENELSRQAAKAKMQRAVVANHGEEPLEAEQTDISDNDLNKIKAAYAKFEKDVLAWEAKIQVKPELSESEQASVRKEQLKYRMYFDQVFYEKHRDSVSSQEWRDWTDAFSALLERHASLIAVEEEPEEDEDEDEDNEAVTPSENRPSETGQAQEGGSESAPSENKVSEHNETEADGQENATEAQTQTEAQTETETKTEPKQTAANREPAANSIFPASFSAADAPPAEPDEDELKGRERELWEYANRRNLSKREAGDRYERYLGYLYERAGWRVEYYGLTEGVANSNRGIDLICSKEGETHFVQSKYWSDGVAAKTNVGNVIDRIVKNMQIVVEKRRIQGKIQAVLAAKPKLSAEDAAYAAARNVALLDDLPLRPYPLVKCSTGKRGSKKYFLPLLQEKSPAKYEEIKQGAWEAYDLVEMDFAGGDCYVYTIEEAEALGYKYSSRA